MQIHALQIVITAKISLITYRYDLEEYNASCLLYKCNF